MKRVACIFSGQGSQYVGMGKDLYESFPVARQMFEQANAALGFDIKNICFEGPEPALLETKNQQLGIVIVSSICGSLIKKKIQPAAYAGLSLGEYAAVWAAGCISFEELLALVKERALAMQEAAVNNPSAMVAVMDVPIETIEKVCAGVEKAYVANINSSSQVVVSVSRDSVEALVNRIARLGMGRTVVLNVSGGFHSPFMKSAEQRLKRALFSIAFKDGAVPVVSNIDAGAYTDGEKIRENLLAQLTGRVLWKDSMELLFGMADEFYELGPSRILKGLLRKFGRKIEVRTVGKKEEIEGI